MITPISFLDRTMCPACGNHTLEQYGNFNKPVTSEDKNRIYNLRCTRCNRSFIACWDFEKGDYRAVDPQVYKDKFINTWKKKGE